jgi:hypothetical protein
MKKIQLKAGIDNAGVTLYNRTTPVSLSGEDVIREIPGDGQRPPIKRIVKAATQEQLRWLFNNGNPLLEEVEVNDVKGKE